MNSPTYAKVGSGVLEIASLGAPCTYLNYILVLAVTKILLKIVHIKSTKNAQTLKYPHCPNVSTTPIAAMGCWQCLPLIVVNIKVNIKVNIAENPIVVMRL